METARAISNISEPGCSQPSCKSQQNRDIVQYCRPLTSYYCVDQVLMHATRRQPRAPDTAARTYNGLLASMQHLSTAACGPCTSGHIAYALSRPDACSWHLPYSSPPWGRRICVRQRRGTLPPSTEPGRYRTRRPAVLGLAYGTDLQEQGSSHPGTCSNKGIAKTATTGTPYLRIPCDDRSRHTRSSSQYLPPSLAGHAILCREYLSPPTANLSSQLALH